MTTTAPKAESPELPELFDTHVHLHYYGDVLDAVLARAKDVGVTQMVTVGVDQATIAQCLELAERFPHVYAAVGIHPHEVVHWTIEVEQELVVALKHPKVVALGETGLDYYYEHSPREKQREVFVRQLALAKQADKPVIIHCRDAADDAESILKEVGVPSRRGVFHCFTDEVNFAKRMVDLGFYISFSGIITFKNAEALRETVRALPLESILIETDCPYLAPVPHRGKQNEPAFVSHVAEAVAAIKGISVSELAQQTTANARQLFCL